MDKLLEFCEQCVCQQSRALLEVVAAACARSLAIISPHSTPGRGGVERFVPARAGPGICLRRPATTQFLCDRWSFILLGLYLTIGDVVGGKER